ncbi:MAG: hypothetical protein R2750_09285 [Bacteroidales bacterium]
MDPNLFYIDFERLMEVLITIVVLSFFVERALSILFESRPFIARTESSDTLKKMAVSAGEPSENIKPQKKKGGIKELISFIVSVIICFVWQFDAISITLQTKNEMTWYGMIITGAIIAGGSKASIKLFKDVLGFRSTAEGAREEALKPTK